jgi:predicted nucleic acid-binding protein
LDVLARREPFYTASARVWALAEAGLVAGFASTLSLPNIFYLVRRKNGQEAAHKAMKLLRDIFRMVQLDAQIINQAIDADIRDFEDAIQFFSAIRADAAVLITRNPKDYPAGDVAIQTPAEFLAVHFPA